MAVKKRRKAKNRKGLYHVIAQGTKITKLGRQSFPKSIALEMAKDLKNRGYGTPKLVKDETS